MGAAEHWGVECQRLVIELYGIVMSSNLRSQFNNEALLGQLSDSMIEMPSFAPTANKLSSGDSNNQKTKNKKFRDFIDTLNQRQSTIQRLEEDIDEMEQAFIKRDGNAWREKLALKILDVDDIPQRHADESMEDYRQRLEPILIDEMLNADGSIKAHYANDPEIGDYAQWAQKNYHLNMAQGYVRELENPNITPERKIEIFEKIEQNTNVEELKLASEQSNTIEGELKNLENSHDIDTADIVHSTDTVDNFLKPPS